MTKENGTKENGIKKNRTKKASAKKAGLKKDGAKKDDIVRVNSHKITEDEINAELLNHSAKTFPEARYKATAELVVRELLIQRAVQLELYSRQDAVKDPIKVIDAVLEVDLQIPEVTDETCRAVYEDNKDLYGGSPICKVSHILYKADPSNEEDMAQALAQAQATLAKIKDEPTSFAEIATSDSACPSSQKGGDLGEVRRGQMVPPFDKAVFSMASGEVSTEPVATQFGYHLIHVRSRQEPEKQTFEAVENKIRRSVTERARRLAMQAYIDSLIKAAKIRNFKF